MSHPLKNARHAGQPQPPSNGTTVLGQVLHIAHDRFGRRVAAEADRLAGSSLVQGHLPPAIIKRPAFLTLPGRGHEEIRRRPSLRSQ
jgi:hypothetical protein